MCVEIVSGPLNILDDIVARDETRSRRFFPSKWFFPNQKTLMESDGVILTIIMMVIKESLDV